MTRILPFKIILVHTALLLLPTSDNRADVCHWSAHSLFALSWFIILNMAKFGIPNQSEMPICSTVQVGGYSVSWVIVT